jgi:hypothetical protein
MDNVTGIAILVLVVIGVCLWLRRGGGATRNSERQLRRICFGNDAQVQRLIDFEMTRTPGLSRAEAASRAVDRYRRDNR